MNRRSIFAAIPLAFLAGTRAFAGEFKRRPAVPVQVIKMFNLQPAAEGTLTVVGENGEKISIDDALWALFEMSRPHWDKGMK